MGKGAGRIVGDSSVRCEYLGVEDFGSFLQLGSTVNSRTERHWLQAGIS